MITDKLLDYLKQPSTYQGLATIAAAAGWAAFPEYFQLFVLGYGIIMGGISVIRNDTRPEDAAARLELKKRQIAARAEQLGMQVTNKPT